jgi:amino acid transporter
VLILWTAFASVFALLFGYSRIPYAAAINGDFFKVFARLHPSGRFPYISLLTIGALSIVASWFSLDAVIAAVMTSRILIQFMGQIVALSWWRRVHADAPRPFRMWIYPVPSVVAFAGWAYIFITSGPMYIGFGLLTVACGIVVFLWTNRKT